MFDKKLSTQEQRPLTIEEFAFALIDAADPADMHGTKDESFDLLTRHDQRLRDRLRTAELALDFYAQEENWTQPTPWGGRIHDEESRAIQDAGRKARDVLAEHRKP